MYKDGTSVASTVNELKTCIKLSQKVKILSIQSKHMKINETFSRV